MMVRQNLSGEVRSQVGEFCQQAIAGRYPFDRNARARRRRRPTSRCLFGPGGKFDQLFQQQLAAYVDTTTRPWRFRPVEGAPLGTDTGSAAASSSAPQAIRDTFFPAGNAPALKLQIQAGRDGRLDQAVHPRRRRPDRALRPRPADPDADPVARAARHGPGARAGQPARLGNDLRHGLRRAVGAVAPVRPRQLRAGRERAGDASAPPSTSTAARRCSRSRPAASAIRSACASCTTSRARWACDAPRAIARDEPDLRRRRHQRGRRPGTASSSSLGDFAQRRLPAELFARVRHLAVARRCATAASSSASAGSTST